MGICGHHSAEHSSDFTSFIVFEMKISGLHIIFYLYSIIVIIYFYLYTSLNNTNIFHLKASNTYMCGYHLGIMCSPRGDNVNIYSLVICNQPCVFAYI
jgi:hypothetical protein